MEAMELANAKAANLEKNIKRRHHWEPKLRLRFQALTVMPIAVSLGYTSNQSESSSGTSSLVLGLPNMALGSRGLEFVLETSDRPAAMTVAGHGKKNHVRKKDRIVKKDGNSQTRSSRDHGKNKVDKPDHGRNVWMML